MLLGFLKGNVLAPGLVAAINLILHWTRSTARRTSQRVCRGRSAVWLLLLRAKALRKRIQDLAVVVLDRPRHARLVEAIRSSNAMVRMISDGDITAAIAPSIPGSGVDLYTGIGGAPEAVLAAAAIRCLGGDLQTMMWPRDEATSLSVDLRQDIESRPPRARLQVLHRCRCKGRHRSQESKVRSRQ